MILLFRPFTVGHKITAAGHTGVVEEVGLLASTLSTPHNDTIIIPNSAITGGSIVNHASKGTNRAAIDVGVSYGTDLARAIHVAAEALGGAELVR